MQASTPSPMADQPAGRRIWSPLNEAIAVGAVILVVAAISILTLRRNAIHSMIGEVNKCITQIADSAASFIPNEGLEDITRLVDVEAWEHQHTLRHLNQMIRRVDGLEHAYIVVLIRDEPWFILESSEIEHTGCYGHPFRADSSGGLNPSLMQTLRTGRKTTTLDAMNEFQYPFVTAYVPLRNPRGDVIAAFAIEKDARETRANIEAVQRAARLAMIPGVVIAGFTGAVIYYIRRRIQRADLRQREIETRLMTSEARFRSLVENLPLTVYRCGLDENWTMHYVSAQIETLTGYRDDEFIERRIRSYSSLIHPSDRQSAALAITHAIHHHQDYQVTYRILHRDGVIRWVSERGRAHYDADGRPLDRTGTINDITKRRQAEQDIQDYSRALMSAYHALEQANTRTEAAARTKMEFLANMSHEIRTPLTAILGFTEDLLDEDRQNAAIVDRLQVIRRNSRHLLTIINDILDLSKIEAGRMCIESIEFSPLEVLADVYELMIGRATEKQIELAVEFVGPIPSVIRSDPTRLRQILINLVGNAIKFTHHGSVRISTRLESRAQSEVAGATHVPHDGQSTVNRHYLRFEIIDTGIGIAPDKLDDIFYPFTQADGSMARVFGGTGLGLSISQRLAALLGGEIEVRSTVNVGSTFACLIDPGPLVGVTQVDGGEQWKTWLVQHPLHTAPSLARESVSSTSGDQRDKESSLRGCRVLLVEDGPDNQRLITHWLTRAGATVDVMNNGQEAVDRLRVAMADAGTADLPDIVLMDMQMPILDGYDATRILRRSGFRRPILALTAHAMNEDRDRCLKALCDDYATKPIHRESLITLIHHHWIRSEHMQTSASGTASSPPAVPIRENDAAAMS